MNTGIVYLITNAVNGGKYVGITTQKLVRRWKHHISHSDGHDYPLYRAIRKYGVDNFKVEPIEEIICITKCGLVEKLNEAEIKYISKYRSFVGWNAGGYNLTEGGGMENISSESRKKQGQSMRRWYVLHPEFVKRRGKRIHNLHRENPEYGKRIADKLKQLYVDEPIRRICISNQKRGRRHSLFDKTIYTFLHTKTGEVFSGTRYDFYSKYNLAKSKVCLLIQRKRKTHKDWVLHTQKEHTYDKHRRLCEEIA